MCIGNCCRLELDFEPLFATVALYDAKEKKKVTILISTCIKTFTKEEHQLHKTKYSVVCTINVNRGVNF